MTKFPWGYNLCGIGGDDKQLPSRYPFKLSIIAMNDQEKTKDQLVSELRELRRKFSEMESQIYSGKVGDSEAEPSLRGSLNSSEDEFTSEAFESTQTLQLDNLFTRDITASGSFDIRGDIWATTFGKVLQSLPIPVALVDLSGIIMVYNQAWRRISRDDFRIIDRPFLDFFPSVDIRTSVEKAWQEVIRERKPNVIETRLKIGANNIWARITLRSIRIVDKRAVLAIFEDLTTERRQYIAVEKQRASLKKTNEALKTEVLRRKEVEAMLRRSLDRQEALLREIHHRVNNNLQIMSSLLRLQAAKVTEDESRAELQEAGIRIQSMALVFEKLYGSDQASRFSAQGYVSGLLNYLVQAYEPVGKRVKVDLQVNHIEIGVEIGVIIGLILCELISNCLKHAFPGDRNGAIQVILKEKDQNRLILVVKDDGVGLPDDVDLDSGSLGFVLVKTLLRQLDGDILINRESGTEFSLDIKREIKRPDPLDMEPV